MDSIKESKLKNKIDFEKSLIKEIAKKSYIYSKSNENFHNNKMRAEAWNEIGEVLNEKAEICKRRWNGLRDTFNKFKTKIIKENKLVTWVHYNDMTFLLQTEEEKIEIDSTTSNPIKKSLIIRRKTRVIKDTLDLPLDSKKCGEILITKSEHFFYNCFICNETIENIRKFSTHIIKNHMGKNGNKSIFETDCNNDVDEFVNENIENDSSDNDNDNDTIELLESNVKLEIIPKSEENEINSPNDEINKKENDEISNSPAKERDEIIRDEIVRDEIISLKKEEDEINNSNSDKNISSSIECLNTELEIKVELAEKNVSKKTKKQDKKTRKPRTSKKGLYSCDQCERIFEYRSQLYRHKRLHTGERPYKCDVCAQAFKHHRNLKDHFSVCHTEERPFPCRHEGCDKKFKTVRIRKLHEILHTDDLSFQCHDCGKCFPQNSYLITHRNTWHVDKNNRRHKCEHCEKTFYSKQNLKYHIYTHTGERPYACPICPTRFTKPWSVKEHMKIHSGERSYICKMCGLGFNQIAGLIKHRKRHEEIVE